MKVSYLLLISLLVVGALFVPAVSAKTIIDEELLTYEFTGGSRTVRNNPATNMEASFRCLVFPNIQNHPHMSYVGIDVSTGGLSNVPEDGVHEFTYTGLDGVKTGRMHVQRARNFLGSVTAYKFLIFFDDWDIGAKTGKVSICLSEPLWTSKYANDWYIGENNLCYLEDAPYQYPTHSYNIAVSSSKVWKNQLTVETDDHARSYRINLQRIFEQQYASTITVKKGESNVFVDASSTDVDITYLQSQIDNITIDSGSDIYQWSLESAGLDDPDDPGESPTLRTGTVTMTDHNGTTITGFEVTAVNAYTDEEYTVSTDTDVAVISLPMDRTIEIRNPQTGVYEEAPIGYYRFYGQAPGYKMLFEDGIQVAVMPEKYGTYKLCDIGVTSESGYLTGKHQFQIRSRSDNSILQSGTISAKSATTGEWYNTTVSGGLASLILPYDTSNSQSQYAGNYYVYATSPGYEDSDYGTQIVVMPRTVSEIKTVLLTPIGGVPTPGNVTLRIQAFSETGPGVVNAEIFIAGVLGAGKDVWDTYTASSTGYLTVSVPGNSTYDIVASGAGFYDSARRIQVFDDDPGLIEMRLYLSGAPTVEPTDEPTGWPTGPPPTQPPAGIPDDDDDSDGFLVQAVRGIGLAFGVGFSTAKIIFGMLLALGIGFATAKQLRGGAAEFGMGLLGGTLLGVLIGLLPVWIIVVLLLVVGLYIGNRYVGGANSG